MKKLLLIGSTVCTLLSTPVTALLGAEIVQHKETNAQATAARLSLQTFVERALENHPAMGKLRETWREQRNLAMKTLAIQELLLTASTGLTLTDPVYSGGAISANQSTRWTMESGLTKTFPDLGGLTAGVSLGHGTTSTSDTDGSSTTVATPWVGLSLSIPLIRNALGSADRASLKKMQLGLSIIDRSEEEAVELLIQSLAQEYYAWALASEKAAMYQGFFERAGQYYNQVLRRANLGIADQSDIMLARQNWLGYQSSLLSANQTANELGLGILARIGVRPDGNTNIRFLHTPDTSLPALKPDALVLSVSKTGPTNSISGFRIVQIARLSLEQAREEAGIARDAVLPDLTLSIKGTKTASDSSLDRAFSSMAGNTFFAGLVFSMPLQHSSDEYSAEAAKNALARRTKEYESVVLDAGTALSRYRLAINTWRQLEKIAEDTSAAAAGRVAAVYTRYSQGRATLNNLTDAQDAWARTKLQALETRYTLRRLELEFASLTDRLTRHVLPD
ncbi:MAG TPA: TolC family protein [Spirochaetota bacterium]|nr:TolC family protein [Spirochaetota bacterium]HPN81947.1 TolC family protein [Spirochaetota bacterium]